MKRIILGTLLLAAVVAFTVTGTATATSCGHPGQPVCKPPPPPPPPPSPPPAPARVGYCLDGQYVNIAVDEVDDYESRGATPAVGGACQPYEAVPDVSSIGEQPPATTTAVVEVPVVIRGPKDVCKNIPGAQRQVPRGWHKKHGRCVPPAPPQVPVVG